MYNKYGNSKSVCYQGHVHDSKKEAERCNELHFMLKAKLISGLEVQKRFTLIPPRKYNRMPNERGVEYIADFVYMDKGVMVVEDCKGYKTPEYTIKRKMFKDKYCYDNDDILFFET